MLRAMARSPIDHLASVSLFSACSKKELQAVARASDQVDLAEGRALCEQGSIGREAFIILEGSAEVKRNGRKVATLGPATPSASWRSSTTGRARPPSRPPRR